MPKSPTMGESVSGLRISPFGVAASPPIMVCCLGRLLRTRPILSANFVLVTKPAGPKSNITLGDEIRLLPFWRFPVDTTLYFAAGAQEQTVKNGHMSQENRMKHVGMGSLTKRETSGCPH